MGEKRAEEESRRKHQAQLSGRAKDTVTRRTVMILVSDHTYTQPPPPTEILSAFSLLCQPPPPAPCISSSSMSISSEQPRHGSPQNLACSRSSHWTPQSFSGVSYCRQTAFRDSPGVSPSPAAGISKSLKFDSIFLPALYIQT